MQIPKFEQNRANLVQSRGQRLTVLAALHASDRRDHTKLFTYHLAVPQTQPR